VDVETVAAKVREQIGIVQSSAMLNTFGWSIEQDGLTVYVTLRHRRKRGCTYLLRATFDDFPARAPSCVFVSRETKELRDDAWPPSVRHSQPPPGICTPGTRECHEHYHRNDAGCPWDPKPNTFLSTLLEIHRWMEEGHP